jgi:hypothetical protein
MSKSAAPRDGVTVVIPAHNAADALDKVLPAWGAVLPALNRPFEIVVVNDGSTDATADVLRKRAAVPHLRVLAHDTRRGFGACLRTAVAEAAQPLLLYAGVDYPYTPTDIRLMLDRIEVRDEIFGKQPDLISGFRAGQPRPTEVAWLFGAWKWFWRVFAGLPIAEPAPWYGWDQWWTRTRVGWVFGVPLVDVNSAFKLYRLSFLKRVPIQSDGDFVHTELVAKATFLTSIMDEIPLTPKPDPLPPLGPTGDDERAVFRKPAFAIYPPEPTPVEPPKVESAPVAPPPAAPPTPEPNTPTTGNQVLTEAPATAAVVPVSAPEPAKAELPPAAPQQPAPEPPPSAVPPAKAEPAPGAPVSEPAKATEPAAHTVHVESQPAPEARPEANAGGLGSPGSPVPAP